MGTGKQYDEEFKKQAIKLAKETAPKRRSRMSWPSPKGHGDNGYKEHGSERNRHR